MRMTVLVILLGALVAGWISAQPAAGDLVVTYGDTGGGVIVVDPSTGSWTTLCIVKAPYFCNCIRMGANNTDLVVGGGNYNGPGPLMRVGPKGGLTSITPNFGRPHGLELDYDGRWIVAGNIPGSWDNALWSLQGSVFTTLFKRAAPGPSQGDAVIELAIDREPGVPPYVLALWYPWPTTGSTPRLVRADRAGILSTIISRSGNPLLKLSGLELDPGSGDYLACTRGNPALFLVTRNGGLSTLCPVVDTNGARFDADGTAWVVSDPGTTLTLYRVTMAGQVLRVIPVPGFSATFVSGVEIYGSRELVCNGSGKPGTTVQINVVAHQPGAANQSYALACSLSRRPGVRFANGEWLHLGVNDSLFLTTAHNLAPHVFGRFRGTTDNRGTATAQVLIPSWIPGGLGITVFVAGVIYGKQGVHTVTNTHWFVLS